MHGLEHDSANSFEHNPHLPETPPFEEFFGPQELEALALPEGLPDAGADQREYNALVERIANAKTVAQQADLFATALDTYGIDTALGMIPVVGDIAGGALGVLFLLYGYHKTSLSKLDTLKILGAHVSDAGLGAVVDVLNVVPGLGTAVGLMLDYGVKSHKYASGKYTEHMQELVDQASEQGVDIKTLMGDVDQALKGKGPPPWIDTLLKSKKFSQAMQAMVEGRV